MQERQKAELEKLEASLVGEKTHRLTQLEAELKARYEEAKAALQEEAMKRGMSAAPWRGVECWPSDFQSDGQSPLMFSHSWFWGAPSELHENCFLERVMTAVYRV